MFDAEQQGDGLTAPHGHGTMAPMKTDRSVCAFLGLGANLGDPVAALRAAYGRLLAVPEIRIEGRSSLYWTEPVGGPPDQPAFLNAVLQIDTVFSAAALLQCCLTLEASLGRVRQMRWGPRILDIDLLLYNDETIEQPQMRVPHPRMLQRAFVLVPLAELAPHYRHPQWQQNVQQHLNALDDTGGVRKAEQGWDQ